MKKIRQATIGALVATPLSLGLALAGPAQATAATALPRCTDWSQHTYANGNHYIYPSTWHQSKNADCTLRPGDANPGVFVLQDTLNRCYGAKLTLDAIYGPKTREAVLKVQVRHKISQDGIYGPETAGAMDWPLRSPDGKTVGCYT